MMLLLLLLLQLLIYEKLFQRVVVYRRLADVIYSNSIKTFEVWLIDLLQGILITNGQ